MKSIFLMLSLSVLLLGNASAQVINLDAKANGNANPINLSLTAGTYTIDPIGMLAGGDFDAWNAWGKTTCTSLNGCIRTQPTTVLGWLNVYSFGSADLSGVTINGVGATPSVGVNYYAGPFVAYADAASALANAWSAQFTLATDSIVSFNLPDSKLVDNLGGMSLDLNMVTQTQAVPEPESIALIGLGLVGLAAIRRRRNKTA